MADWKALSEIVLFKELFEDKINSNLVEKSISNEFDKIPFSAKQQKRSDKARTFLISSIILTVAAAIFYFWNPVTEEETTLLSKNNSNEKVPLTSEDPFAKKDWAELRNYRNRNDIIGTGFVVARDRIDEEFPILKGAVSTNVNSKDIEYRIYPVPGAHLMPLSTFKPSDVKKQDHPLVFYCRSGARSHHAAMLVRQLHPNWEIYNLEGGILSWIKNNYPVH
jgi:rhodanese-related sulfurtransferase